MDGAESSAIKAYFVRIDGRVQGVGFRYWTIRAAERLGIRGWVRNEADGSVSLECEGSAASVDKFLHLVRQGPPGSWISRFDVRPIAVSAARKNFSVRF